MRIAHDHTHVHVQVNLLLADAMTIDSFLIGKGERRNGENTAQLCEGYLCMIFAMLTQNQHQLFFIHPTIRFSRSTSASLHHYHYSSVIFLSSISASLFLSSFHSVDDQNNLSFFLAAAFDFASSFRSFFSLRQKSPSSDLTVSIGNRRNTENRSLVVTKKNAVERPFCHFDGPAHVPLRLCHFDCGLEKNRQFQRRRAW